MNKVFQVERYKFYHKVWWSYQQTQGEPGEKGTQGEPGNLGLKGIPGDEGEAGPPVIISCIAYNFQEQKFVYFVVLEHP